MSTHDDRGRRNGRTDERHERAMFAEPIEAGDLVLRQAGVPDMAALSSLNGADPVDDLIRDEEVHALVSGGMIVVEESGIAVARVSVRVAGVPGSSRGADALLHWTVAPGRRREGIGRRVALAVAARAFESGCEGISAITAPDDHGALEHLRAVGFDTGDPYPGRRNIATLDGAAAFGMAHAASTGPR